MKLFKRALTSLVVFAVLFCYIAGWFSPQLPWEQSTGWSKVENTFSPATNFESLNIATVSWLGHSGFLLELANIRVLIDPILSNRCVVLPRLSPAPLSPEQLGDIDLVLISHSHFDHLDMGTLERLSGNPVIVMPKGSEVFLSKKALQKLEPKGISPWETVKAAGLKISGTAVEHNGNRFHPFNSSYFALGYVIETAQGNLYYAGDTGYGQHFLEVKKRFAPKIAILPIGGYEPHFVLKHYHINPEEAAKAASELGVAVTIPAHFGTFRMAFDAPDAALPRFLKAAQDRGVAWYLPPMAKQNHQRPK